MRLSPSDLEGDSQGIAAVFEAARVQAHLFAVTGNVEVQDPEIQSQSRRPVALVQAGAKRKPPPAGLAAQVDGAEEAAIRVVAEVLELEGEDGVREVAPGLATGGDAEAEAARLLAGEARPEAPAGKPGT